MVLASIALSAAIGIGTAATDLSEPVVSQIEPLGQCRITEYCPQCNDGAGHESSTGVYLQYGHCACSWLEPGTEILIDGEIFTVVDTCGTDAIDIFTDTDTCQCNRNEYKEVTIKKKR